MNLVYASEIYLDASNSIFANGGSLPLIEFVSDVVKDSEYFKINVVEQRLIIYGSIEARIFVSYCSDTPLKEVRSILEIWRFSLATSLEKSMLRR